MKSTGPDNSTFLTTLITAAALLGGVASTQAQGPDDEHWFYEYDGPRPEPFVFEIDENYLYAGGLFLSTAGDSTAKNLARFNLWTEAWEPVPGLSPVLNGGVWAIHSADNGKIYLGGNFSNVAGTTSSGVVEFDPSTNTWASLTDPTPNLVTGGQESGPTNGRVRAIQKIGQFVYVGGEFTGPGGSPQDEKYIRRFHLGTRNWSKVGGGLDSVVHSLLTLPDGSLLAGGEFTGFLSRWNGSTWSTFGGGLSESGAAGGIVRAMDVADDGTVYVGGQFDLAGGSVACHDVAFFRQGSGWNGMNGGFDDEYVQSNGTTFNADGVWDVEVAPNGDVYAGGDFQASAGRTNTDLDHVALWDGSGTWKNLGSGVGTTGSQIVNCLTIGPRCDLYVGGTFREGWLNAGSARYQFARWDISRDFTGYIPGALENPTTEIVLVSGQLEITLISRPGTNYEIESSSNGISWGTITGTEFVGNGLRKGWSIIPGAGNTRRMYRFKVTE